MPTIAHVIANLSSGEHSIYINCDYIETLLVNDESDPKAGGAIRLASGEVVQVKDFDQLLEKLLPED